MVNRLWLNFSQILKFSTKFISNPQFKNVASMIASQESKKLNTAIAHKYKSFIANNWQKFKLLHQLQKDHESVLLESEKESDPALIELFENELTDFAIKISELDAELSLSLIDTENENLSKVVVEIRPGTGGDEAALFAKELSIVYEQLFQFKNWDFRVISETSNSEQIRELIYSVSGCSYADLQFETGVHRVQRVPETDSQGRIHTSTVTVAVIPQNENEEFKLNEKDIRMDVFRSSGPGGQNVNKTNSAVRLVHTPTGITVSMQDERSQILNKMKALQVLQYRLQERDRSMKVEATKSIRSEQIGTGNRSDKIRTYNFPQNRITDHRTGLTVQNLPGFFQDPSVLVKFIESNKQIKLSANIKCIEDILLKLSK